MAKGHSFVNPSGRGGGASPMRPRARELAQHGSLPRLLEKSDSADVILYVMDGSNCLYFPYRTGPYLFVHAFGEGILLFYETSIIRINIFSIHTIGLLYVIIAGHRESQCFKGKPTLTIKTDTQQPHKQLTNNNEQPLTPISNNRYRQPIHNNQPPTIANDRQRKPKINRQSYMDINEHTY
jgi:hypothetical protein